MDNLNMFIFYFIGSCLACTMRFTLMLAPYKNLYFKPVGLTDYYIPFVCLLITAIMLILFGKLSYKYKQTNSLIIGYTITLIYMTIVATI